MTPLGRMVDRLARLPLAETQARVLRQAAAQLQAAVTETLSAPPGDSHATPWLRTGALRDSIAATVEDEAVVVGSTSIVAAAQELGTATVPPRPFLAPAAQQAAPIAEAIGAAFAALLQGRPTE